MWQRQFFLKRDVQAENEESKMELEHMPSPRRDFIYCLARNQIHPLFLFCLLIHNLISVPLTYLFSNQVILMLRSGCVWFVFNRYTLTSASKCVSVKHEPR